MMEAVSSCSSAAVRRASAFSISLEVSVSKLALRDLRLHYRPPSFQSIFFSFASRSWIGSSTSSAQALIRSFTWVEKAATSSDISLVSTLIFDGCSDLVFQRSATISVRTHQVSATFKDDSTCVLVSISALNFCTYFPCLAFSILTSVTIVLL